MRAVGLGNFVIAVEQNICPNCNCKVDETEFVSEVERREFKISGLCKHCQDEIFG